MQIAIDKACEVGTGVVTVHNGHHLGMAQYHALLAVPHGMIGVCLTASGPLMVPTFGREPVLGTNPIAIAVPCGQEPTFVFDAATTVVAGNKIIIAHRLQMPLPPGLLSENDGTPIMHSIPAPATYSRLLPLGSTPELASHKGYGLACAVDILTNVLGGLTFGAQLDLNSFNHCIAAINIRAFSNLDDFKRTMDDFVRALRETPPADGQERVLVPGQLEWEAEQERRSKGIPLHPEFVDWLDRACAEIGV
jgi:LDH2 family malate/lactate/ureidoglycolate dehydrogenase